MPSAQKEQSSNTSDGNHVGVFGHEETGEFHAAVFRMETSYQFVFRFWQIERDAIGFRKSSDQENDEAEDLPALENAPGEDAEPGLLVHHLTKAERVHHQQRRYKCERSRQLLTETLSRTAQP